MEEKKVEKTLIENNDVAYLCIECGPYPIVWVEKWSIFNEHMVRIAFVSHNKGIAKIMDILKVRSIEDGDECVDYSFCGQCNNMIPRPMPVQMMHEFLHHINNNDCDEF